LKTFWFSNNLRDFRYFIKIDFFKKVFNGIIHIFEHILKLLMLLLSCICNCSLIHYGRLVLYNFFHLRVVLWIFNFLNIDRHFLIFTLSIISWWHLLCTLLLILIFGICNFVLFHVFELYIIRRNYFFYKIFSVFGLLITLLHTICTWVIIISFFYYNLENILFKIFLLSLKAFVIIWRFLYFFCLAQIIIIVHFQHTLPHWFMDWMVLILL